MAYQALYRKYRPSNFDEVVGQTHIIQTLKNAIVQNRIAHAYLFCGPRGTGKTSIAKIFAKTLNCTNNEDAPCGICENCKMAANGSHPDIIEIDAASNNGVDEVRNLIDKVKYAPMQGKYKIYIIDEVHMMTSGAFNALLKTIEEPPAHVIFIFATTEPNKVLPTIISRCQRFDFNKVSIQDIKHRLSIVCKNEGIARLCINYGKVAGTYYIDNFKFGEKKETATAQTLRASTRAGGISYKLKTPEEKKAALLGAMEAWIKGMLQHQGMERVKEWDVINEPIADNNQWRGIDGNFMSNGDDAPDTAPVEDEENGLNLNWANDHFYWGYYIGKEYAVKAFEYARKYAAADVKLYVNDYNLETNPSKLAALIDFVNYIEDNGQTVDGIGTQMHVTASSITREQIDAMFKTMAATGKLVRVTELDVALGTSSPSAEQLATQANVYQMIFESYKANVPESQQSGITIWTLSDNAAEHEYWLSGDAPNLFDANYERKHAYKGVCDGIAGKDISEDFSGDDWKNAYETEGEETPAE